MITIKKNPETVGKLKVGTSAATPADGEIIAGKVKIDATDGAGGLVHENASGIKIGTDSNTTTGYIGTISNHPLKLLANNDGKVTIDTSGEIHTLGATNVSGNLVVGATAGVTKGVIQIANNTHHATNVINASGTILGAYAFKGSDYAGQSVAAAEAAITAVAAADQTQASAATDLLFWTKPQSGGNSAMSNQPIERMRISSTGLATFSGGIAFSQTNASGTGITSDASTLSHYEVGRWTPKYQASAGNDFNAITYGFQDGHYVRVGNVCTVTAHMRTTNVDQTGMTTSANLLVGGLPFPAATVTGTNYGFGALSVGTSYAGNTPTTIKLSEGVSAANLQYGNSNSNTQVGNMTVGSSVANFIGFQFTYQV